MKGRLSIRRPDTTAIETIRKRAKQIIFYVFRTVGEFTTKSICCTIDIAKLSMSSRKSQQLLFRSNKRTRFEQDSERSLVII